MRSPTTTNGAANQTQFSLMNSFKVMSSFEGDGAWPRPRDQKIE